MKYLSFLFFLILIMSFIPIEENSNPIGKHDDAFTILETKCNVCHNKKNPSKIFTKENMDGFANKINRQVFVFKRMPKGNEISLTKEEKKILRDWIKTLKTKT